MTKSDIEVWRHHIGTGAGRMVVLNKIDSMWDELRTPSEVEGQISQQVASVAHTLAIEKKQDVSRVGAKGFGRQDQS